LPFYVFQELLCYYSAMRKTFAIAGFCLILAACGGSDSNAVACDSAYWSGTVGTCLPAGWNVVERKDLEDRGIPDEVLVAFQSETPYAGQFATVTVTRETLAQPMTSTEYSDASIASVSGLPGYTEVERQNSTVDGEDVELHVFTAQPRQDSPESRFYQVSAVNGGLGYTFTAAIPVAPPDELEANVLAILRAATFTNPENSSEESK
jgi:hypothetical protein